jgi:hypothetical protein
MFLVVIRSTSLGMVLANQGEPKRTTAGLSLYPLSQLKCKDNVNPILDGECSAMISWEASIISSSNLW